MGEHPDSSYALAGADIPAAAAPAPPAPPAPVVGIPASTLIDAATYWHLLENSTDDFDKAHLKAQEANGAIVHSGKKVEGNKKASVRRNFSFLFAELRSENTGIFEKLPVVPVNRYR